MTERFMQAKEITVSEIAKLENVLLVDVRESSERELAHIPDSIHVPLKQILSLKAPKEQNIVVYCASGCRSSSAAQSLTEAGYRSVYSLKGGIQAWQKAGLEIVNGSSLKAEQLARYSRQISLAELGVLGQKKLLASKVLIVGAGGLGSPVALYLAGAGVGTIGIVDSDKVEIDNLHRQIIHRTSSIQKLKTDSAFDAIKNLNSDVNVKLYSERLTNDNSLKIFDGYDVVVDGSDNFPTRYNVNIACVKLGIPLVHGSILRFSGQVSVFDTKKGGPCYSCVYPEPPPADLAPSCVSAGVLGAVTGIIGSIQALETLKIIAGFGQPLFGKLLIFDGLTCKMSALELKKDHKCKVCI